MTNKKEMEEKTNFEPRKTKFAKKRKSNFLYDTKQLFHKLVDETLIALIKMLGTLIALAFILSIGLVVLNKLGLEFDQCLNITKKVIDILK